MRLQLALDFIDIDGAKAILKDVSDLVEIVEIGTPFLLKEGVRAITEIKTAYPSLSVLADIKIMDAGAHEAKMAYDAGADIVTVLAAAADVTIERVVGAAQECQKEVLADLIAIHDIKSRAQDIDRIGVDYLCVHTATDLQKQGRSPLADVLQLGPILRHAKLAIAGGINVETLPQLLPFHPDIVIVGGSITGSTDRRKTAMAIKAAMQ